MDNEERNIIQRTENLTDEIKTIDDAINEATMEMITNKEEFK